MFFWREDKAGSLNNPGIKYITKGEIKDNPNPINVSCNKRYWVFLYTASNIAI